MTTATLEQPRINAPDFRSLEDFGSLKPSPAARSRANRILSKTIESFSCSAAAEQSEVVIYKLPPNDERDDTRILAADEELAMFRAMNDAKHRADQMRKRLSASAPSSELMDEIERLLELSDHLRNRLVRIFMKLGASIARKLASVEFTADELISEANVTLLRAVERFDCERGFRFSTYATNACRRNLIRHIKNRRRRNAIVTACDNLDEICEHRKWTWHYEQHVIQAAATLDGLMCRLEERDQYILRSRHGLIDNCRGQSLQRIADVLGVSRERVRQLESRAAERLRQMAQEANFDPLDA